jgi:hypothetical protein
MEKWSAPGSLTGHEASFKAQAQDTTVSPSVNGGSDLDLVSVSPFNSSHTVLKDFFNK